MSKPVAALKNTLKQQSYEIINAYFDLEDKIKKYKQIKSEVETKHNISITPLPDAFKGIPEDITKSFDIIANYSTEVKEEDIEKLKLAIDKIDEELEQWMEKVNLVEIKLQKMKKNGMEYHLLDPKLRKLIKTLEKLKREDYNFEDDDDNDDIQVSKFGAIVTSGKHLLVQESEVIDGPAKGTDGAQQAVSDAQKEEQAADPTKMTDTEITTYITQKFEESSKRAKSCLEKLASVAPWTKAKDLERELFFLLNAGSDAEYLKTLQIDEEKITNLENDVHALEKKANNLECFYQTFEDKYLKDPKRKSVVKKSEIEQRLIDYSCKISCVRNLKRVNSDSCLLKRMSLSTLVQNTASKKTALRLLNFLNESNFVIYEPSARNIKKRLEVSDLKRKFQVSVRRRSSLDTLAEPSYDQLQENLASLKDEEFKKLMTEHVEKIKTRKEELEKAKQENRIPESVFESKLRQIKDRAAAEMSKIKAFLEEGSEAKAG